MLKEQLLATFFTIFVSNSAQSEKIHNLAVDCNDDRFENWRIILTQDHGIKPFVFRIVMIVLLSMRSGRDKNTNYSKYEQ